jgi:hypothetical protein
MKIPPSALLFVIGIVLLLASLPAPWFDLKSSLFPSFTVTGLNGSLNLFGVSTPLWALVLVSEIGLMLGLCRSMGWTETPSIFCFVPLWAILAALVYMAAEGFVPSATSDATINGWGAGIVLATAGILLGIAAMLMRSRSNPALQAMSS